ncbi:fibronectin type III domain-containing protein [Haloarchaeobius sp. HRN-SO-5]|uniref:fibronectin type III domain-containing protein n=1 Tax=Haloarchaeobius sp. HRN-SO-5 TaxID=3446118 RepID=UPI003EC12709
MAPTAPSNPTIESVTATSVTVSWTDNSTTETEFRLLREEDVDGTWKAAQVVATVGADVTQATDTTPRPGTTYRYWVRADDGSSTADSSKVEATTTSLGVPQTEIPSTGWYVEVDHPSASDPRTPTVLDDTAEVLPRLNARPEVRVPVRRDESWLAAGYENTGMRVWKDGQQLPIDELADVEITPGQTVLVGRGASELDQDVTAQYSSQPAMDAFTTLVESNTSLTVNADSADPDPASQITVIDESTPSGLETLFGAGDPTDPFVQTASGLELAQTCWTTEGEAYDRSVGSGLQTTDAAFSGGAAGYISSSGDTLEWDFTTQHTIPAEDLQVYVRYGNFSGSEFCSHTFTLEFAGGGSDTLESLSNTGGDINLGWRDMATNPLGGNGYGSGDLPPGTHTLKVEATGSTGELFVDVIAPADGRFSYTLDDDNGGSSGYLDGPELYPVTDRPTTEAGAGLATVGASATTSWTSTAGSQQLELSNDKGATYPISGANTQSVSGSFPDAGASVQLRATWSGHGSRSTATPQTGYLTMSVESVQVTIDGKDIPVISEQRYRGRLREVLRDIASTHDLIYTVERNSAGDQVIELTRPGLRQTSVSLPTSAYSVEKQSTQVLKATIEGVGREASTSITASHGTGVVLGEAPVITGSERVLDQTTGTPYDYGEDYTVDWAAGEVTALSTGDITDGETVDVEYRYKTTGTYQDSSYSGDPSTAITRRVPELTSERACETFAFRLVDELKTPLWTASVELSSLQDTPVSLVDALTLDGVPAGTPLEVWTLDNTPTGVRLQLGSRDDIEQTVTDLRTTVGALNQHI